ncbi:hypothetical protein TNCT_596041 [Trichonephila clavata]|uniref:Uncharacterized protein n=1 Tax=Trichonephila clavata TaxID=2740835 RepID=A0A8X6J0P4_TRICU|nr:hypothetical protein TNCT_596041 [Trichonephila clavata]
MDSTERPDDPKIAIFIPKKLITHQHFRPPTYRNKLSLPFVLLFKDTHIDYFTEHSWIAKIALSWILGVAYVSRLYPQIWHVCEGGIKYFTPSGEFSIS